MIRLPIFVALVVGLAAPAMSQEATRKIHPVKGDVYLFQNNFHMSLIVPTSEGTVRVDPINAEAGAWLNENLSSITDQPVTHLIYSHSHGDHASGGSAHEGAMVIAHENAPAEIDGVAPDMRVGDSESFEHGGKTFELTYLGPGHGKDMLAVVLRPENVAFIVDVAAPKRLFYQNFGGANLDDWEAQIEKARTLDFEVFAPGHGNVGTKADLDEVLVYMQDLRSGVQAGLDAGKSVDEIKSDMLDSDYNDWMQYEAWRPLNIEGMAAFLQGS